tara:strand:+ start:506 stop:1315 length:810 start_codon:yes stop_codon:yes gene_type:complete
MSQTLLLLDGANLMQRARFSSRRNLKDSENAIVYSFFRSLRPLVEKFNPDKIILALEGRPVRRLEMHEGYKATRTYDNSDGYSEQRRVILELLKHLPVEVVRHPEREADDVIGYFALDGDWDHRVVVSSDTDFIQLINADHRCKVYNPITKKMRDAPCSDYVGWKSLVGDSSDNIDGFKGVGNKTALKLMSDPKLLHEFLQKRQGAARYEKNRELIAFEHVDIDDVEVFPGVADWQSLESRFRDLGFWSMVNKTSWPKYVKTFEGVKDV